MKATDETSQPHRGDQPIPPLPDIFERLRLAFGAQHWWPARSRTEVAVGAILTQNTAWRNVERAVANLSAENCLSWEALRDVQIRRLEEMLRPSGTFRVKARRLKSLVETLWRDHGGSLSAMLSGPVDQARRRLLAVAGIGPETADAILLYAGARPTFVVDAYTVRMLRRHGLIDDSVSYGEIRSLFLASLPDDVRIYNEFHALFVELGKRYCRRRALCDQCPLVVLSHDETLA